MRPFTNPRREAASYSVRCDPRPRQAYERSRDLARLLALWPEELADGSVAAHEGLVKRLFEHLRRERQRGLAGDWCYDLARHRQLLTAYRAESAALAKRKRRQP